MRNILIQKEFQKYSKSREKMKKIKQLSGYYHTKCHEKLYILILWFLADNGRLIDESFTIFLYLGTRSVIKFQLLAKNHLRDNDIYSKKWQIFRKQAGFSSSLITFDVYWLRNFYKCLLKILSTLNNRYRHIWVYFTYYHVKNL